VSETGVPVSSAVKRALVELREMRARLEKYERAAGEPIAITGMGMRLPGGVVGAESYWDLLREGRDAITEVPLARWDADGFHHPDPDAPGRIATRYGGFLDHVDEFDARFFGITPREAVSMDPQQRLLLEVAWEALEHAGQAPDQLGGQPVGVFVGLSSTDYLTTELKFSAAADIDAYLATGGHPSVASGRLSYVLGLRGPSLTVDTACSSSLAAIHLAAQSLRGGECRMALAGGVSLMLMPELSVNFSRARMMSPDGRCKTFDSRADGYVRSEGCGVLVLKRLSDAIADGDRVLAVVRGSALNQDGRSSGLTVPNGPAQEAVIQDALRRAGVRPADVDYVEAHGTGTALGDPVELRALGEVFRVGRETGPLLVGSVKTNVGHLEAAAGVAGVMKVVLALQHDAIPPHLHLQTPTPHVDWARLSLDVPTALREWRRGVRPRIAGISAFGFSGTNAHVVLSEAPASQAAAVERDRPLHLLTLSAKSAGALRETASRLGAHAATATDPITDLCYTANVGRAHHSERAAVLVHSAPGACEALAALAAGEEHANVITSSIGDSRRPEVAFLFAGQGTQYAGMGRGLFEAQPVFRRTLQACDELLRPHLERPLLEVLYPGPGQASPIDETAYAQPVLFAFEYALAEMWRSWGVEPTLVLGHSLGEDVAACVAGVFGLEDGLTMVARRARLMESDLAAGAMASVFAPEDRVRAYLATEGAQVEIAAFNGPHHVVISGPADAVARVVARLEADAVKVRPLITARACHSSLMDPVLDGIEALAASMTLAAPHLGLISTLTGRMAGPAEVAAPPYWRHHVREPVRFTDAIQTLYGLGIRLCVEIGPNGTLTGMARRGLAAQDALWLPSLKRDDEWTQVLTTLGTLHTRGVPITWAEFDRGYGRRKVTLPSSPFERTRYWSDAVPPRVPDVPARPWSPLGRRMYSPALADVVYESRIGLADWPPLEDHRVRGRRVAPAALFAGMALDAAGPGSTICDLRISEPLVVDDNRSRTLQLIVSSPGATMAILSADVADEGSEPEWTRHATATLTRDEAGAPAALPVDLAAIRARCEGHWSGQAFYGHLEARGLAMGAAFRAVQQVFHRDGEALGEVEVPTLGVDVCAGWQLHPILMDASCQVAAAAFREVMHGEAYLMTGFSRLTVRQPAVTRVWSHVRRRADAATEDALAADVVLFDDGGAVVAEIEHLAFQRVHSTSGQTEVWTSGWLHELAWRPQARPVPPSSALASPNTLAGPTAIGRAVQAIVPALAESEHIREYGAALDRLDRLATAFIVDALRTIGVPLVPGARLEVDRLVRDHGIAGRCRRILQRFLRVLEEDGILSSEGDAWIVRRQPANGDTSAAATAFASEAPSCQAELRLTARCGAQLAGVLQGRVDPVQQLFPGGSTDDAEQVYRESPAARLFNGLAREAIAAVVRSSPATGALRVLEIGAGTGGTTAAVVPELPAGRTRFTFTDVSPLFLQRAEERFTDFPFIDYRLLDLEHDPLGQGFTAGSFDVVIAVNVLHATGSLTRSLARVRNLLAPGGLVLIGEATVARRWLDVTFGLTDGWWKFEDLDVRSSHPLLGRQQWLALLEANGYTEGTAVAPSDPGAPETQALFVARSRAEAPAPSLAPQAQWLVLADTRGIGEDLVGQMRARGLECVVLSHAGVAGHLPADARVAAEDASAFDEVVARVAGAEGSGLAGCVNLWGLDARGLDGLAPDAIDRAWSPGCLGTLHLAQALVRASARAPIWTITGGAVGVHADDRPNRPAEAAVWGLGRVIALEHPEVWGGLIDVDPGVPQAAAAEVLAEIMSGGDEDQIALRDGCRYVARLANTGRAVTSPAPLRADATYLITGGMGRLGLAVARWLATRGAGHVTLLSRSALPPRDRWDSLSGASAARVAAIRAIEALGTDVAVVAGDVTDAVRMEEIVSAFGRSAPPLRGVVHAASAAGMARVAELTAEAFRSMLAPKVTGTVVLQRLCARCELDFFVLFSSTTGLLGSVSLGHYAAANTFLDAFAQAHRSDAFPITSIAWGAWEHLVVGDDEVRRATEGGGLKRMPTERGLEAMGRLLRPRAASTVVVDADWPILKAVYESRRRRPLLDELGRPTVAQTRAPGPRPTQAGGVLRRLEQARASDRREILRAFVLDEAARVLRIPSEDLDPDQGLFDLGMDSLMSVELKGRLENGIGRKLPTTLTFNYPSVSAIADFLSCEQAGPAESRPAAAVMQDASRSAPVGPAAGLDVLSEDELAVLLAGRLAEL
jgi:acyl transferase domain-containing protein/acyl carrier protein